MYFKDFEPLNSEVTVVACQAGYYCTLNGNIFLNHFQRVNNVNMIRVKFFSPPFMHTAFSIEMVRVCDRGDIRAGNVGLFNGGKSSFDGCYALTNSGTRCLQVCFTIVHRNAFRAWEPRRALLENIADDARGWYSSDLRLNQWRHFIPAMFYIEVTEYWTETRVSFDDVPYKFPGPQKCSLKKNLSTYSKLKNFGVWESSGWH